MIHAGVPKETNAFTINKVCASGLKAIALGAQSILAGEAEVVVGWRNGDMSQVPYAFPWVAGVPGCSIKRWLI